MEFSIVVVSFFLSTVIIICSGSLWCEKCSEFAWEDKDFAMKVNYCGRHYHQHCFWIYYSTPPRPITDTYTHEAETPTRRHTWTPSCIYYSSSTNVHLNNLLLILFSSFFLLFIVSFSFFFFFIVVVLVVGFLFCFWFFAGLFGVNVRPSTPALSIRWVANKEIQSLVLSDCQLSVSP